MNSDSILFICLATVMCIFVICSTVRDFAPKDCETIQATELPEGDFE